MIVIILYSMILNQQRQEITMEDVQNNNAIEVVHLKTQHKTTNIVLLIITIILLLFLAFICNGCCGNFICAIGVLLIVPIITFIFLFFFSIIYDNHFVTQKYVALAMLIFIILKIALFLFSFLHLINFIHIPLIIGNICLIFRLLVAAFIITSLVFTILLINVPENVYNKRFVGKTINGHDIKDYKNKLARLKNKQKHSY